METLILEILDEKGRPCPPGVEGNIVVTSLANEAMPLIRYQIGDWGALADGPCGCGRGLQLLKQVTGRLADCFRRSDGTVIPGEYFIHFLGVVFNRGWIGKVQIVQEAYEQFRVKVVPREKEPSREELGELEKTVKLVMGEDSKVGIQFVEDIPSTDSGKYRYTICNIP